MSASDTTKQVFEHGAIETRQSNHYAQEYVGGFAERWDELVDWDGRAAGEGQFFIDVLKQRGAQKILDVATGTGFHSVRLIETGFEVTSADGAPAMLAQAFDNGRKRGHVLRTVHADWRWLNRDVHGEYDAIICLGNSFTHLFEERARRKALAEFYTMLKHDGVLILDQRNYDALLDGDYGNTHKYYYCGESVSAEPEHVDEGLARFKYTFEGGDVYHLNMCPIRKDYTRRLMHEVGFQNVATYGDFQETYREDEPDFFIHVAEKEYQDEHFRE
jgi:SAM-dependent methyltransferase